VAAHSSATLSRFLPTARRIQQFASGRAPGADDRVVYIAGAWDLFHVGHIAALQEARKLGTFVLVGIHDDETVNRRRGGGFPVLNLHERTLSVLACRYADEVIIGAPLAVSEDMVRSMNIVVVARGSVSDARDARNGRREDAGGAEDPYAVPARLGLLRGFASPSPITAYDVVDRVLRHRETFEARQKKKVASEAAYYTGAKTFVAET
jgi:ethanolamine-phosphate cytidylyltransferase